MSKQTIKTTIEIDAQLLYLAKMKALKESKSLKEIMNKGLEKELGLGKIPAKKQKIKSIGGYKLGGIKGSLRRIDIYENL